MAKTKNKKTAVEELEDILFDTLNPKCWKITPRTCGGKPDGHYLVICDEHPGCDAYLKEAVDDVYRGIAGTKFEGKIHLYYNFCDIYRGNWKSSSSNSAVEAAVDRSPGEIPSPPPCSGREVSSPGNWDTLCIAEKETYMANIKLNYKTIPLPQYVSHTKTEGMKYTRTTYHCPLCRTPYSKREFEDHVYKFHGTRADECFAMLFGVPWPARCTCGRELRYSQTHKGFPTTCGNCTAGTITGAEYKNEDDANKAAAQLKAMLVHAQAEAKRLAKEAELARTPLNELPFPTKKDPRFLKRISKDMRGYAINGEKEKLIQLANFIDAQLAKL